MKICTKCQQEYPNGFQYCPNDTELLVTKEEYVRNTRPLAPTAVTEPAESRVIEVVPISTPKPVEKPVEQLRPPVQQSVPKPEPEAVTPPPIRKTEAIPPRSVQPEAARVERRLENRPPAASESRANGSFNAPAPSPPIPTSFYKPASKGDLNFALPEGGSLISRLVAGLQNIGEAFKRVSPQTAGTGFTFLLPEESLTQRIRGEVKVAWAEFRRDPRRFVVDFIRGEGVNRARRNAMLAGSEMAVVGFMTLFFLGQILSSITKSNGWLVKGFFIGFAVYLTACYFARGFLLYKLINSVSDRFAFPKIALEIVNWAPLMVIMLLSILLSNYSFYCKIFPGRCELPVEEAKQDDMKLLALTADTKIDLKLEESAKAKEKSIGGSKPKPKPAAGGGGGGRQQPEPPSKGVPPQMALTPQIIMPSPEPPKIKNPTLIVAQTVYGDPKALPPMKGPIGDPTGVPAPPSSGPGTGAGIGRGAGTGVGGGQGGGVGPGRGGNTGGGDMSIGGGRSVEPMSASLRPTILYKEKAKYTEEARQNKVQGTVVLNVVFTADGRISNIRVVRGLPDGLTEKAIEAAQKIRFNPAVKNGVPVSVRGNLEFTFNLY